MSPPLDDRVVEFRPHPLATRSKSISQTPKTTTPALPWPRRSHGSAAPRQSSPSMLDHGDATARSGFIAFPGVSVLTTRLAAPPKRLCLFLNLKLKSTLCRWKIAAQYHFDRAHPVSVLSHQSTQSTLFDSICITLVIAINEQLCPKR